MKDSPRFFIDTSGLYALLCPQDPAHEKAASYMKKAASARHTAVLSDYVLDESATLLMARKAPHLARTLFELVRESKAIHLAFMDSERFGQVEKYFLKHIDQGFSFTDCFSFVLMREMKIRDALTTDRHFNEQGFKSLL
jgi:uncharacterized protein